VSTAPFPAIERAVKEILERNAPGKVGGDLSYERGGGHYVWFALLDGSTSQLDGEWIFDIDVFADNYSEAMARARAIEALLIGPRVVTSVMRFDNVYQNSTPKELPWPDDGVFRIGATYVFTGRRPADSA
jgi:hypothetical protein